MTVATLAPDRVSIDKAEQRFPVPRVEDDFIPAPDIRRIVDRLLQTHAQFSHLVPLQIVCLWKKKGGNDRGRALFGKIQQLSGLASYFAEASEQSPVDLVLITAADNCYNARLTHNQVEALIFHELNHVAVNDEEKIILTGHDAEMFQAEIEQYGFWAADLQRMASAFRSHEAQLPLDLATGRPIGMPS